jgi:ribose transport system substrate-binding protein
MKQSNRKIRLNFKMKRKMFFVKLLLVLLGLMLGCKEVTEELIDKKPEGAKTIIITMIAKSSANPVFLSAKTGAEKKAKDISEKYSLLDVVINWKTPENENAFEQAEIIRNSVREKTNAIIVSCSDKDSLTKAINYAVDNGVPVMTFDSDAPDSKRFAFYGPDDVEMGQKVMNYLAGLINSTGKIAILGGNQTANNLQKRIEGVKKAASDYPNIKIVGTFYHPETEADAIDVMKKVQETYPDLKGWAMVGSWPMFGNKLEDIIQPGKIKIVGVDALPVELKYIEKNYVQVLLGQPTFRWGEVSVETVIDKIYLKKDVKEIIRMNTIPVTIENLGGWSRQLKAWGYTGIPEKYFEM